LAGRTFTLSAFRLALNRHYTQNTPDRHLIFKASTIDTIN
jgi:hypothetical protein